MAVAVIRRFEHDPRVQRYRFFWIKYVKSVNLEEHCQPCLKGPTSKLLGTRDIGGATTSVIKADLMLNESAAEFIYICGVTEPYNWASNFHMALRVQAGESCRKTWPGIDIELESAVELEISDAHMDQEFHRFVERLYRTCRNAHFAWAFHKGVYDQ